MPGRAANPVAPAPQRGAAFPALPRRVVRHLVFAHGLGVGSRVVLGGDGAEAAATLLARIGMAAETAGFASLERASYDAAFWLDLSPAPPGERSLFSAAALGRTAGLLAAVRPGGWFVLISRVCEPEGSHDPGCLEQHLSAFPGTATLATFADRTVGNHARTITGEPRPAYAVLSWQAPAEPAEPSLWRRKATAAACGLDVPCCRWAAQTVPSRQAA